DKGNVVAQLAAKHTFIEEQNDETGSWLTIELSEVERNLFQQYITKEKSMNS
ncbi:MAG: GTPase HflX, partial [Leuconostoc mesenteroides]